MNPSCRKAFFISVILFAMSIGGSALGQDRKIIIDTPDGPVEVPLTNASQVKLLSSGDIQASSSEFSCSNCEDVQVQVNSFTINGATSASIPQGNTATFRWESRGAWSCEGAGLTGWTGTGKAPSNTGGQNVATGSIPLGTYEASLTCSNGAEAGSTVSVTIEEATGGTEPVPEGCENRTLPSEWVRRTTGSNSCILKSYQEGGGLNGDADCRSIAGVWGSDWPMDSVTKVLTMGGSNGGKEYVAMEFTTSVIPLDHLAQISVAEPQAGGLEPQKKIWTISKCPGDFSQSAVEAEMGDGCYQKDQWSASTPFKWGGLDYLDHGSTCALESNTRYFLNIMYSDSPAGTPPSELEPHPECISQACGNRISG